MKGIVAAAALLMSGFLAPAFAYDDFETQALDPARWWVPGHRVPHEIRREVIDEGGSRYLLIEDRYTGGFDANDARGNVLIADPEAVDSISVPVFIEAMESEGAARTRFRVLLENLRMDDGNPGGTLWVSVDIEKRAGLPLRARYFIERCEDDYCNDVSLVHFNGNFAPVAFNTWHTLGVSWSEDQITFSVDGVSETLYTEPGAILTTVPADRSWVLFGSRFRDHFTEQDAGYLRARVGQITVNGALYEDYALGRLDPTKWLNPDRFVRAVSDGQLQMALAATSDAPIDRRRSSVNVRYSEGVSTLAADIIVDEASHTGNFRPRARIGGHWYNIGGGSEGSSVNDIFAEAALYADGDQLKGRFLAWHCMDEGCQAGDAIWLIDELGPFSFGETYRASVAWDGESLVFNLGSHQSVFTPEEYWLPAGPPNMPNAHLGVRFPLWGVTGSGEISARFDNVTINRLSAGFSVVIEGEPELFVPAKYRYGTVNLITVDGEQRTIAGFDPDTDVVDFSVLLSKLHNQDQLQNVRFLAQTDGDDLLLSLQRTSPSALLAQVRLAGLAHVDPQDLDILLSARPFSDWFFPAIKSLFGEEHVADYLHGFRADPMGDVQHAYTLGEQIRVDVKARVVTAEGEMQPLLNQQIEGYYSFVLDIARGIDEYSMFPLSMRDPRYTLPSDQGLATTSFGPLDPPEGLHGVTVSFEPFFDWLDELDVETVEQALQSEEWQEFVSYMRLPAGNEPVPGRYNLLELLAYSTVGVLDPVTGDVEFIESGTEIALFAATTPDRNFETWLDWFPAGAEFIILHGEKYGEADQDGDENVLGSFFALVDEITVTSGSFSATFAVITPKPRSRGGLPVWLLGTLGD